MYYVEDLKVDYHPIHRWFLCSASRGYAWNFNGHVASELRLSTEDYATAMKEFNGKILNSSTYFKRYEDADAAKEWLQAMITMVELRNKGGGF